MLSGIGTFMLLAGWWMRKKAAQGIGTMNEEGATERIAKARPDGDPAALVSGGAHGEGERPSL